MIPQYGPDILAGDEEERGSYANLFSEVVIV